MGKKIKLDFLFHKLFLGETSKSPENGYFPGTAQFNSMSHIVTSKHSGKTTGMIPRHSGTCRETLDPTGPWKGRRVDEFLLKT